MPNLDIDRAVSLLSKLPIRDRFSRRIVPFQPNPGQRVMIEAIRRQQRQRRPIRIIALKARRVGVSALSEGLGVCHCLSDEGKLGLIVAHMFKTSKALFEVPTNLLTRHLKGQQSLCELLGLPRPTKHRAVFPHDAGESELNLATAGNVEGGRGQGFSYLHLSEAAFFPGVQSFVSLLPTVPHDPSTIIVIESTANGRVGPGEDFYDFWNSAVEGANDYAPIFIPWYTDPHCSRPADEADDAPANDYEKMLMSDFSVNKAQIAWYRATLETECKGYAPLMQQEYPTCLMAGTLVGTNYGIVPVESAQVGWESELGTITASGKTGHKRCLRAITACGRILEGSYDHPLEVVDGGFVELQDSTGKLIRLLPPRFAESEYTHSWLQSCGVSCSLHITPDFARFLGYFTGDGSYGNRTVSICCDKQDTDVVADVSQLMTQLFGAVHSRTVGSKQGGTELRVGSVHWAQTMKVLGIWHDEKPHRKVCVPEAIMRSPKHIIREYLRGLFEADGFNAYKTPRIVLFSKHIDLLRTVQLLLLGFGITSRIATSQSVNGQGYKYTSNVLQLRSDEVAIFKSEIGFVSTRKHGRFQNYKPHYNNCPIVMADRVTALIELGDHPVYDLHIDNRLHVFSANGLSVHNTPEEAFIATGDPAFDQAEIAHVRTLVDAAPQPKAVHFLVESLRRPEAYQVEVLATTPNDIDRITDTYLLVWESPRPDCRYKLGADAARGEEDGDFAAICVWNEDTGEQAAQLDARIPPEELALWCNCIGRWYNNAMVNIELTGNLGVWAQKVLRDNFKYPFLYRWKGGRDDRIGDSNRMSTKRVIGWETTERSKQMAFDAFRAGVRQRRCFPRSVKLLQQMDSATRKEGFRWEVLRGHDDILMAALVGWIAVEQWGPPQRDMPSRGSQGPYGKGGNATEEPKVMGDVQAQAAAHFKRIMSAVRNRIGTDRLAGI